MKTPLVSVIVPVHNGERFLAAALQSIFQQDYSPLDVIVVDDGSTDGSRAIAESFEGVRYLFQVQQGAAAARNAGVHAARGELVAFLDADDLWTRNKLRVQVEFMRHHPEIGFTLAQEEIFFEPGANLPSGYKRELVEREHTGYLPGTLLARKCVFDEVGLFDPRYQLTDDADWLIRARDAGIASAILPERLLLKRVHSSNISSNREAIPSEMLSILKRSIERRRNAEQG